MLVLLILLVPTRQTSPIPAASTDRDTLNVYLYRHSNDVNENGAADAADTAIDMAGGYAVQMTIPDWLDRCPKIMIDSYRRPRRHTVLFLKGRRQLTDTGAPDRRCHYHYSRSETDGSKT